ncbi:hypothetical protein DF3PB_470009 [uncultured Defluviicoccus sp.]|uniref:Uncharacterized protein n=1 Tax=metagenome TaxID=256318 RepID=A0A380THF2_9ZZZZ|nr:hypothetical protein DF3PB_470009 [uncultured Defluviicoccus sp.]
MTDPKSGRPCQPKPLGQHRKCNVLLRQAAENNLRSRPLREGWCPRPELNRDHTFRKRALYPFELRGLMRFKHLRKIGA